MKLEIELIPESCFYRNLRNVLQGNWVAVSNKARESKKCDVCGAGKLKSDGKERVFEAHEVWEWVEEHKIQRLKAIRCVCKLCHMATHMGRTRMLGEKWYKIAVNHFRKINKMTEEEFAIYAEKVMLNWQRRSLIKDWKLEVSEEIKREYRLK